MPITHAELQHHRAHGAVLGHADHVRRLGEHGAVVVDVLQPHRQHDSGAPGVHRAVRRLHHQLVLAGQLAVQGRGREDAAVGADAEEVGVVDDAVAHLAVLALVGVRGLGGRDVRRTDGREGVSKALFIQHF